MVIDRQDRRDSIVEAMLPHVAFDGWSMNSLVQGVKDAGYPENMAQRAFPNGMGDVTDHFAEWSDRRMLAALETQDLEAMKVRARIHACIKTRIQINAPHKEALRRLLSYLALPSNAPLAARLAWRSCSAMWYAAGDRSADWNHYTKRGLLVGVYSSTLLYWLGDEGDESGDYPETWAFLDRRISDVLKTFGMPGRLKAAFSRLRPMAARQTSRP